MTPEIDDRDEGTPCVDCGALLWGDADRSYEYGPGNVLCFECAEARGGVYDEVTDRWMIVPDATGLWDERRLHP